MKDVVVEAVRKCATARIEARDVPRGFRVSTPFFTEDDHLWEVNVVPLTSQRVLLSDAGEFHAFLDEEDIGAGSEAVARALSAFEDLGFRKVGDEGREEIVRETDLDEVGCVIIEFAQQLASTSVALAREHREGAKDFASQLWRQLRPVRPLLQRNYRVRNDIHVWAKAKNRPVLLQPVGSYGKTVEPKRVAWQQLQPFYALKVETERPKYKMYALLYDEWYGNRPVRRMIGRVAEVVRASDIDEVQSIVRGEDDLSRYVQR